MRRPEGFRPAWRAGVLGAVLVTVLGAPAYPPELAAPYSRPGTPGAEREVPGEARHVIQLRDGGESRFVPVGAVDAPSPPSVPAALLGSPRGTTPGSIPATALEAYQRAAAVLAQAAPSCRLDWSLLAGVGRIESDHGRYGGATLGPDGVSRPRIIGIPLDGVGAVAMVRDTDEGQLDGDPVWDRAVGPMQFIPSTWAVVGVDGDADGSRSPDDIDDAALAAGVYLCAGTSGLDKGDEARAALLRFNHSSTYASLVMAYADSYATGTFGLGAAPGPAMADVPLADVPLADDLVAHAKGSVRAATEVPRTAVAGQSHRGRRHSSHASRRHGRDRSAEGAAADRPGSPATRPSRPRVVSTPLPATPPSVPESGPEVPAPDSGAPPEPAPETPVPDTGPPPSESPGQGGTPATPETVEGVWMACLGTFCLDDRDLDLGDTQRTCQVADYDGDEVTEPLVDELAGLVGQTLALTVLGDSSPWLVVEIRGLPYPRAIDLVEACVEPMVTSGPDT